MTIDLPDSYKHAAQGRKLLPFVGSGFSKNVSLTLPDWSEVMQAVAQQLDFDPDVLLAQGDYLQIAEYLQLKHRQGALYNELSKRFDDRKLDVTKSKAHLLLTYLDVPAIFTTNWDSWIEAAFDNEAIPYKKLVTRHDFLDRTPRNKHRGPTTLYDDTELTAIRKTYGSTTVVKFHGDFTDHDSIVFAENRYYDRMDFEDPLDLYLRSELLGRSVVFIGYSFSDQNVRFVWHKLNKLMKMVSPRELPVSYFVTSMDSPVQKEILQSKNIEIIMLDPNDLTAGLVELFEATIEYQRSA